MNGPFSVLSMVVLFYGVTRSVPNDRLFYAWLLVRENSDDRFPNTPGLFAVFSRGFDAIFIRSLEVGITRSSYCVATQKS
ncbi:hypothetical protein F5Y07DRAFT_357450 [Xylaria sp. FL0933]|nr:hypothetical protein F5Y07DRAFT_357450 [Xylaria sp. FL0933]